MPGSGGGAIEYMEARGIPHSKADVFRFNGTDIYVRAPYIPLPDLRSNHNVASKTC
jgi:hypothetical protein